MSAQQHSVLYYNYFVELTLHVIFILYVPLCLLGKDLKQFVY